MKIEQETRNLEESKASVGIVYPTYTQRRIQGRTVHTGLQAGDVWRLSIDIRSTALPNPSMHDDETTVFETSVLLTCIRLADCGCGLPLA